MTLNHVETDSTTILLIRHGETAWNVERRLQGHLDIGLNAEGERQAAALGAALAGEHIDRVLSSDLARARHTAEAIVAARGLIVADTDPDLDPRAQADAAGAAVERDPHLRERCYGGFEGMLYSEIAARFPREFAAWQARDIDAVLPPGKNQGETFRAFFARTTTAILGHAARHPGQTLALVAHGGVLECAYRAALGLPLQTPRDFKVHNASINRFVVARGKLQLVSWGEIEHLRQVALDDLS